jgi:ABC-2 type transport system permease protein
MSALVIPLAAPRASRKYLAVAAVALRQRLGERATLLGRAAFYVLLLFIFDRLWRATLPAGGTGAGPTEYVWYIAVSEWITLAQPRLFVEIERDVRSGDLAYALVRPTSYLAVKLSEAAAELALSLFALALTGCVTAYALTSGLPADPRGLLAALALGLLSATLFLLLGALIGLCAFWVQDCSPLYWVFQKAYFVLGGLLVPLQLYPDWLRALALWTPFSAMIHGPASMVFGFAPRLFALYALKLAACAALTWGALDALYARALRSLELNGG